ncbi:hypothetical protein Dimus_016022 [Dionaea muscipula]
MNGKLKLTDRTSKFNLYPKIKEFEKENAKMKGFEVTPNDIFATRCAPWVESGVDGSLRKIFYGRVDGCERGDSDRLWSSSSMVRGSSVTERQQRESRGGRGLLVLHGLSSSMVFSGAA